MRFVGPSESRRALTLIDVLIAVATVALVVTFFAIGGLPRRRTVCGLRVSCVNNLRQVGIAYRIWATDHSEQLPWAIAQSNGGTFELATSTRTWLHFQIASNELNSPKILACPSDPGRTRAVVFDTNFANQNISYFIGLDADETKSQTILSGDRNLSTNKIVLSGVVTFRNPTKLGWTSAIHTNSGNVGFADGSAQEVSSAQVQQCVTNAGLPLRLNIP